MTNQVIPAEAVEAAARGICTLPKFDALPESRQEAYRKMAHLALEAAAPHMLAAAWEEALKRAAEVAWEHDASASSGVSQIPNPYRTAK